MPRMTFLKDVALQERSSPLHAWPEVAEEQEEQRDSETGQQAGHQYQATGDNAVSTDIPDGVTVQPRIKSRVVSPLTALSMYGRAVGGPATSTRERHGGVVNRTACSGRLSPGSHDAIGGGHEKQKQPRLRYVAKSLAIGTAIVAAVMLVVNQEKVRVTLLLRS